MAMNCPFQKLRIIFYKLRGTKIERNVFIAYQVFLEEVNPELITIRENSDIGPRVMVITHDTISDHFHPKFSHPRIAPVIIGKNCYIGAGAIILPGVSIGDNAIIGAGAVVNKSIPTESVAVGVPAKIIGTSYEWVQKHSVNL
jgi:acetyltransferase-like isoleucine patch superfamily enzyme